MNIAGKLVARKEEEEEDDDDDEAEEALNRTEAPPIDLRHNTLGTALPIDQLCSFIGKDISSPSELTDGPLRFEKLALFNHHARRISNQSCKVCLVSFVPTPRCSVDLFYVPYTALKRTYSYPCPLLNFMSWARRSQALCRKKVFQKHHLLTSKHQSVSFYRTKDANLLLKSILGLGSHCASGSGKDRR